MTIDQSDRQTQPTKQERGVRPWVLALVVVALLPTVPLALAIATVIATNNLDPAHELGIPDDLLNGLILATSGAIIGLVAGLLSRAKGVRLAVPALAAALVGAGTYAGFALAGSPDPAAGDTAVLIAVWFGQALAIWLGLRSGGPTMAVGLAGVLAAGFGVAFYIGTRPLPPAEVVLVLTEFETAGSECSGAGALEGVIAGSELLLIEWSETTGSATEIGSVRLPVGTVEGGECLFDLGHPLDRPTLDYANIEFLHESAPGVPQSASVQGDLIVVRLGVD